MIARGFAEVFAEVFAESGRGDRPRLDDDLVLLDSGLDSLGFAVLVTQLEDELGYDSRIAARLFARSVGVDESAFAEEPYVSLDQLRLMRRCGMEVGGHGDAHDWLGSLTADEQRREVDRSLDLLRAVGVPDDGWTMAYPYGDWDARVLDLLAQRGRALGLTSEVRVADLDATPAAAAAPGHQRPAALTGSFAHRALFSAT